jgi:hypothetical protein
VIPASLIRLGLRLGRALPSLRAVQFVHRLRRSTRAVVMFRKRRYVRRSCGSRPRWHKLGRLVAALRETLQKGYLPDWRPTFEIAEDFYALAA